jgi:diguanylate cyclase (GGDEF)-like protein
MPLAHRRWQATMMATRTVGSESDLSELLRDLIDIGIALTSERDLGTLLERIVAEARRFTHAEAGTLFLREGDALDFAVVQNDLLVSRLGETEMRRRLQCKPLPLAGRGLAAYVALTGKPIIVANAYQLPSGAPYVFDASMDRRTAYETRSVLAVPLREPSGAILGVLELINTRDDERIVEFDSQYGALVQSLASQAAVAIRNAMLEELSFKDPLTGAYNRRYFRQRVEEESKRFARFGEPLSVVLLDLDHFKPVNDRLGHDAGDEVLKEVAQVLMKNSRSFSIVTRYGGDEFAVLLVNTSKSGATRYAERIKMLVEDHTFKHGAALTASMGIATLPDDVTSGDKLIAAADRALYVAKRLGRNAVTLA